MIGKLKTCELHLATLEMCTYLTNMTRVLSVRVDCPIVRSGGHIGETKRNETKQTGRLNIGNHLLPGKKLLERTKMIQCFDALETPHPDDVCWSEQCKCNENSAQTCIKQLYKRTAYVLLKVTVLD